MAQGTILTPIYGRVALVATAALTVPDERATERIVEAMDWEHDRMADGAAIAAALRRLDADGRAFAQSVLCGRSWDDMGMSRSTFYWRLKKLEDFFRRVNTR